MPENVVADGASQRGEPEPQSIEEQLKALNTKIAEFEAQKNDEKQAALQELVQASDDAIAHYPYEDLRVQWCAQQEEIEKLYRRIVGAFPKPPWNEEWKELIKTCICPNLATVSAMEQQLRTQLGQEETGGKGAKELARDQAKKSVDAAQSQITALLAIPDNATAMMNANKDLIGEVGDLLNGPDPATALYPFWFQLVPAHQQLRPKVKNDCQTFETPAALCATTGSARTGEERALPWLMTPQELLDALWVAWKATQKAAADLATAERDFQAAPDSIDAVTEQLATLKEGLRETIDGCLKAATPKGDCCTTAAS